MIISRKSLCTLLCLGLIGGGLEPLRAVSWQRVAGTIGIAPGVPGHPNARHFILQPPTLNNSGQVAFHSFLDATTVGGATDSVWAGAASDPHLVVRKGDPAPGTSQDFGSLDLDPLLNNAGQLLINARVSGGNFDQANGLWLGSEGNLQLLARTNTPISGSAQMIRDINRSSVVLSDNGKAAFLGTATNNKTAMWYGSPGNLVIAAMEGNPVPSDSGLPANVSFEVFLYPAPVINSTGKIAFEATVSNGGTIYGRSIWTGTPGNLQLLVREETAAPGVPGEDFYLLNAEPVINNAGTVAFGAQLSNFNDSIWMGTPGNLTMILQGDDPAPVGTAGVRFADFGTYKELRLSDSGHVAFESWLEGTGVNSTNNYGLFRATIDGNDMVTRLGRQAPGMPAGAVFQNFDTYSINPTGQLAFIGSVNGGGVSLGEGLGIWAQNQEDELELVVRVGDWVHPMTGSVIRGADVTNTELIESQGYDEVFQLQFRSAFTLNSEYGTAWNSEHQIAFEVIFANQQNGSAIFLADLGGVDGDFDGDGDVDGRDFLVWQRSDKSPAGLAVWQENYGAGNLTALAAVPEPTALAFVMACGLAAMAIRKRT